MAGNIKGITIEFSGDTTRLDQALRKIDNETKSIDKELRAVDKALKFNPTSVELWRQKQDLLKNKIAETKDKLDVLKQAQAKMDAEGVDKNSAEYRELQREIIVAENQVKNFEGQLRKVGNVNLRATSEQFKEYGTKLTAAGNAMKGVSMAAAGLVASLGAVSVKAGRSADDLNTLSKVTGIGTGDLQKYGYAADLVDTSVEAIAKSTKRLTRNAYEAANGSSTQAESFKALGVSVTDADGNLRDSDAIFQDVISALGQMTNETERDALAQKLMGKSAAELNPLIEDGGETYKMVADTLAKYNLDYVDQETLDKANEFNDSLDTMKLIGSVALAQVGSALASTLAPALEKVVDLVGRFANWLGNLDPRILTVIGAIAGVVAVIAPVLIALGKVAFAISSIMSLMATIGPVIAAISGPVGIAIAAIAALVAIGVVVYKNWDKIKAFASKVWEGIKTAVSTAVEAIKKVITTVFDAIKAYYVGVFNFYKTIFTTAFNAIKTIVTTVVNGIKTVITTIFNAIKTYFTTVINGYKIIFTTAWNIIKTVTTTAFNLIKNAITNPINAAKTIVTAAINAIKNAFNFGSIVGRVQGAFNSVKNAIANPIQTALSLARAAVNKIKGIFPVKLGKIFSGVKLPHFKISGGRVPWGVGGKGTPPKVDIDWYRRAMNDPYMFSSPTLFGAGEAGDEILYGRAALMRDISKAVANADGGDPAPITINVYGSDNMNVQELAAEVERRLIEAQKRRRLAWQ